MSRLVVRLREHRSAAGLTQAELAERVGVSRKTVNTVENGVFVPSTELALRIAHALSARIEAIFALPREAASLIDRLCGRPIETLPQRKETKMTSDLMVVTEGWMRALDAGDIEGLLAHIHPEIITANEGVPTVIGRDAVRAKYAPRMERMTFRSTFDPEHEMRTGEMAVLVGRFGVTAEMKDGSGSRTVGGRLLLGFRRDDEGAWKIAVDMDNTPPN